jgi:hypothetical protein
VRLPEVQQALPLGPGLTSTPATSTVLPAGRRLRRGPVRPAYRAGNQADASSAPPASARTSAAAVAGTKRPHELAVCRARQMLSDGAREGSQAGREDRGVVDQPLDQCSRQPGSHVWQASPPGLADSGPRVAANHGKPAQVAHPRVRWLGEIASPVVKNSTGMFGPDSPRGARLGWSGVIGAVTFAVASARLGPAVAAVLGWIVGAGAFVLWTLVVVGRLDGPGAESHATREDSTRVVSDLILIGKIAVSAVSASCSPRTAGGRAPGRRCSGCCASWCPGCSSTRCTC